MAIRAVTSWAPAGVLAVLMTLPAPFPARQRDVPPPPQQPTTRRVAVGTASIAGMVTTADTGRPIRGARVSVGASMSGAGRVGGLPAPPSGVAVSAGSQGPGAATLPSGGSAGRADLSGGGPAAMGQVVMSASRSTVTDEQGNFILEKLPAGQYSLNVSAPRNAFLPFSYGQKKPNGPSGTFLLADGQQAKLNVQLIRGGAIIGTVFGPDGDPMGNSQVRAWRYAISGGVKRLQSVGYATTDDRGMYRLFGLQPGDYVVSATPETPLVSFNNPATDEAAIQRAIAEGGVTPPAGPGLPATVSIPIVTPQQLAEQRQSEGPPPGYLPVFYPGTPVPAGASAIHVAGGDEHAAIDIQVQLVQATNIQGTIANPPAEGLGVQLSLVNDDPVSEGSVGTRADTSGHFTLRNVAPGKYTLLAQVVVAQTMVMVNAGTPPGSQPRRQLDDSQKWWGRTPVSVEGEPTLTTSITLKPGRTIAGRIVFEMERLPDLARSRMMVTLGQAPGMQVGLSSQTQGEVGPDASFTIAGVMPGKYTMRASGWLLKSAMINGQDVLDFPLNFTGERDVTDAVLTITDKITEVSGTLTDAMGRPATDYMIVAAAADERFWTPMSRRIVVSRPGPDGRYMLRNLPPGDYLLAGVTDLENGGQYDPEFLKSLAGAAAMRITVVEGGRITQDLRVAR